MKQATVRHRELITPNRKRYEKATYGEYQALDGRRIVERRETLPELRKACAAIGYEIPDDCNDWG